MLRRIPQAAVALMATAYSVLFTYISFLRYDSFSTWALDMGNMDQAVWNTIHGRILAFTNMDGVTTRLAIHCEPLLIVISPIYLFWSDPRALLLLQTLALASAAFPVFWIARSELKNEWAGVVAAAFYLLFPSLEAVNVAEFHAVALSAPLLLWAYYFGRSGQWIAYAAMSVLAAGAKEEVGMVVFMMGLYLAITRRSRVPLLVAGIGAAWSLTAILVVIPRFNPLHKSPYAGYYGALGSNVFAVAWSLIKAPWIPLQLALQEPEYLKSLLAPGGWLSLLSPERLLIGVPSFLINVLSGNGEMQRPNLYHYTAPMIPALVLGTIGGAKRLVDGLGRIGFRGAPVLTAVLGVLLLSTAVYHREEGLTPLSLKYQVDVVTAHDLAAHEFLRMVPTDAKLSVHPDLDSHLSQRQTIYVFPRVDDAEYVLMDRLRDRSSRDVLTVPTEPHKLRIRTLDALITGGEWDVLADKGGYVLLKRK